MIVSMPRSGSQVIQMFMSWFYRIPNLQEPFNDQDLGFDAMNSVCHIDPYEWTANLKKGVFKLLAQNLYYINIKKLLEIGKIDHVILLDRNNLTDCCVSAYYGNLTGKFHYTQPVEGEKFECPSTWVRDWIKHYYRYQEAKEFVIESNFPHSIVNYEDFVLDKIQYIAGNPIQNSVMLKNARIPSIATNLPYNELCVNYQQVKEQILTTPRMTLTYKFTHQDT